MVTIQLNTVVLKETASETTVHLLSNLAQFFESSSSHWSQNKTQKMGPHVAPTLWEEETANTKVVRQRTRDV